ncbi:MAG: hypothetical protein ABI600_10060 [Luteolibacter sp.]
MKVTKVCCQGCGADLQIDESIRYVTCNYCHAQLEVVHDASVTHTRQLDKIERTTDQLANNLKVIELQNDLERIDREWDRLRGSLLSRDKYGNVSEPSLTAAIVGSSLCAGIGLFCLVAGAAQGSGGIAFFGLIPLLLSIYLFISGTRKASDYQNLQLRYTSHRRKLITRIDHERVR